MFSIAILGVGFMITFALWEIASAIRGLRP